MRGRTAPVAKRGVGDAAPYEVLSVNGVVGVGLPDDPPSLAPHSLQKPCHCEPVTDSLLWQSVLLVLGTGVLRIPTTSLRTGLGMTRKFFRLLSLLWQSVPPVPENAFPFTQKKGSATRQSPFSNRFNSSEIRIAHCARVQLHIPDVAHSREVHDHPLKAQAEACVLAGAVAPQVAVPPVVLGFHP